MTDTITATAHNAAPGQGRIRPITAWRALVPFLVVLAHSDVPSVKPAAIAGVVFMLMGSGMLMTMRHEQQVLERRPWRPYLVSKAIPLYAHNWLALALMLVFVMVWNVHTGNIYWPALPWDVLLLQSWIPSRAYFFSFNSVCWFLCTIFFCYLCFPLLCRILCRWRLRIQVLVLAMLWLAGMAVLWPIDDREIHVWCHVVPVVRIWEFAMGIVVWHLVERIGPWWHRYCQIHRHLATWAEVAMLVVMLIVVCPQIDYSVLEWHVHDSVPFEWPVAVGLLLIGLNARCEGAVARALCRRPLMWLGSRSMELFLYQAVAAMIYAYLLAPVLGHFGIRWAYDAYVWLQLPVMVIVAWFLHRFITPVINALARRKSRL